MRSHLSQAIAILASMADSRDELGEAIELLIQIKDTLPEDPETAARFSGQDIQLAIRRHTARIASAKGEA